MILSLSIFSLILFIVIHCSKINEICSDDEISKEETKSLTPTPNSFRLPPISSMQPPHYKTGRFKELIRSCIFKALKLDVKNFIIFLKSNLWSANEPLLGNFNQFCGNRNLFYFLKDHFKTFSSSFYIPDDFQFFKEFAMYVFDSYDLKFLHLLEYLEFEIPREAIKSCKTSNCLNESIAYSLYNGVWSLFAEELLRNKATRQVILARIEILSPGSQIQAEFESHHAYFVMLSILCDIINSPELKSMKNIFQMKIGKEKTPELIFINYDPEQISLLYEIGFGQVSQETLKETFTKALRINPEMFEKLLDFYCANKSDHKDLGCSFEFLDLYHFSKEHYCQQIAAFKQSSKYSKKFPSLRRISILARLVKDLVIEGLGCTYREFLFDYLDFERPVRRLKSRYINETGLVADILVNGLSKLFAIPLDDDVLDDIIVDRIQGNSAAFSSFKGPLIILSAYFDLFVTKRGVIKAIDRQPPKGNFLNEKFEDYSPGEYIRLFGGVYSDEFLAFPEGNMDQVDSTDQFDPYSCSQFEIEKIEWSNFDEFSV